MFLTRWQKVRRKVDTFTGTATRRLLRGPPRTFLRLSQWDPACGLRSLEHEGKAHFEDTAVVTRDADGNAHVKNEASSATETGAAIGGMVGLMVAGILF